MDRDELVEMQLSNRTVGVKMKYSKEVLGYVRRSRMTLLLPCHGFRLGELSAKTSGARGVYRASQARDRVTFVCEVPY